MSRQIAALGSAIQHAIPPEFSRKWGMEFPLPTLLCAGYSVKLKYKQINKPVIFGQACGGALENSARVPKQCIRRQVYCGNKLRTGTFSSPRNGGTVGPAARGTRCSFPARVRIYCKQHSFMAYDHKSTRDLKRTTRQLYHLLLAIIT